MDGGFVRRTTTRHESIWVRRGICRPCRKTFTILPDWLIPSGHFSLRCRSRLLSGIAAGDTAEQAAPHCKDLSRSPDASTVRRWTHRRLMSLWCWLWAGIKGGTSFKHPPSSPGISPRSPYSAVRGKKSVTRQALDELKQQIPLLDYLQAQDWRPARHSTAADGWDCARCTAIASQASWWIPTKACSTAMAVAAAVM